MELPELLAQWDSGDGKPYKGRLIDWDAWEEKQAPCAMCAQGQVLHLLGSWSPKRLRDTDQDKADKATAKLLNISIAHSILLRSVNDSVDGAPSIVLTHPEKVLGDQAHILLAFWLHMDRMKAKDWSAAWSAAWSATWSAAWSAARSAARSAAGSAARSAAWSAAWSAARSAAGSAAGSAAWSAAGSAAGSAAWSAAGSAEYACAEIQGAKLLREQGSAFYFLPHFGFANPEAIPPLPADYGRIA
jgi:hypothetical protein